MLSSPPIRRALLSVSDKTGIVDFAAALARRGIELISTGGTAQALAAAGLAVREVASVTGMPELLDGRVKTLHPAIHGGLLARRDRAGHLAELARHGLAPIDLLACNLYPFALTLAAGADREAAIENIDIGGVALLRAAAKNHDAVIAVCDPADYPAVLAEIETGSGATTVGLRCRLAAKAYAATAAYDAAIAGWLAREIGEARPETAWPETGWPETAVLAGRLVRPLRYGENPHQRGAIYRSDEARPGVATARQLQGRELSYTNYADADAAFELVAELAAPAVAIVKHASPCGVATGASLREAWDRAYACDPQSAFGGVVALNRPLDLATAEVIGNRFVELVIAPQAQAAAAAVLARRAALRLLVTGGMPDPAAPGLQFRSVAGGILMQERDARLLAPDDLRIVTKRAPSPAEIADLLFADTVAKHVKSNAIVFVRDGATVGIGGGQPSRVDSVRIAAARAAETGRAAGLPQSPTQGSVLASDAFFPFADGLDAAIAAGVVAVIQPGGSVRDAEIIAAADAAGLAMVFSGTRRFRH